MHGLGPLVAFLGLRLELSAFGFATVAFATVAFATVGFATAASRLRVAPVRTANVAALAWFASCTLAAVSAALQGLLALVPHSTGGSPPGT